MNKLLILLSLFFLFAICQAFAGNKLYTDEDLQNYKYSNDDETYQYNQEIFKNEAKKEKENDVQRKIEEHQNKLKRISELEEEIKELKKTKKINGFLGFLVK